ncbi:hypothetical protein RFI_32520, partial [Reticulomyxa filosa]
MDTLPALSKLDASRLPCGVLEKFVLSPNRKQLFGKSGEEKKSEDKKNELIPGSEDYTFYSLLQLSNEVEALSSEKVPNNQKLEQLNKEIEKIYAELQSKEQEDESYEIPSNIIFFFFFCKKKKKDNGKKKKKVMLRHKTRAFEKMTSTTRTNFLESISDDLSVQTDHTRP